MIFQCLKSSWDLDAVPEPSGCSQVSLRNSCLSPPVQAFLTHVSHMDVFHVGLKWSLSGFEWKWLDGTVLKR